VNDKKFVIKLVIIKKLYFIQFTNNSKCTTDMQIKYRDKQISVVNETISWATY